MKKWRLCLTGAVLAAACLTGCQQKDPQPGEVAGYDEGEEYLSIWVHSIEDTEEGQAYKESVDTFNEAYDGQYFADIEFVPRNDSGGGYSDKVNASVMSGGLPDVLTVDGPNISAYAANGIIQPLAELTEEELSGITVLRIGRRTPGGGNNNRRAKIYVDNIELSSQSAYTISNLDAVSGNGKLSLYWDEPNVTYSGAQVYVNDELKAELPSGVRGYTVEGLTEGETYNVRVDIVNSGEVAEGETYRLTVGALDTAAAAANTEFGDFTLNASNSSAAKTIDGRYVALTGADVITLNVGGADTTDAGDVYIDLIENDENGERFRAPIGMYASGESKELTIPIEAFECVSQRNNGQLDLAAVKYISAGAVFEEGSADQISVAGMRAETYTVAEDSDVTISSVEASPETGKSDVTIEVAAELNTANAGLYVRLTTRRERLRTRLFWIRLGALR